MENSVLNIATENNRQTVSQNFMTAILGIIGHRSSIIAADGRVFKSFDLENGKPKEPIEIETESFNKTFSTSNRRIVGGYSGLMRFSDKTTGQHLEEIFNQYQYEYLSIEAHLNAICGAFQQKLLLTEKIIFNFRNVSVIFSTFQNEDYKKFILYKLSFQNISEHKIEYSIESKLQHPKENNLDWYIVGDQQATSRIQEFCYKDYNKTPKRDFNYMESLAKRALKVGKDGASDYFNSGLKTCGGDTKIVTIKK